METAQKLYGPVSHAGSKRAFPCQDKGSETLSIKKHEALLRGIAGSFGFNDGEARALVDQVCACAAEQGQKTNLPLRIWMSRLLVRQCVFRIGNQLFAQSGSGTEKDHAGSLSCYRYRDAGELILDQMPLSFRTVYILAGKVGFTEKETASVLNTTRYKVRERYRKALFFLGKLSEKANC